MLMRKSSLEFHNSRCDAIIEEIMKKGTYTLRPRKSTNLIRVLLSAGMTYMGLVGFLKGELFGLVVAGFFGFGVFTFGCAVLSYCNYLLLTPDGLTLRSSIRLYSFKWTDIKYFAVCGGYLGKDVKFGYSDPRKTTSIWTFWEPGISEVLILQTYGMSARDLAELLTALQKHFSCSFYSLYSP
jgi:hypothetical protein